MLLHHHALATNSYAGRSKLSPATAPGHDETSDTVDARAVSAARDVAIQSVRLTLQHRVGAAAPTVYRFEQPRIQIGRALDNDVVISTLLRKVSRYHAEIYLLGGRYWLCDLGSKCGTLHNGLEVAEEKPVILTNGDVIQLGDFLLEFSY